MGAAAGPNVVEDGLVLALDAGSSKSWNASVSTKWEDRIGSNDGTLVNGTYHNDGPFVGAGYVEFDGTSDYLDIASSTDFAFGTGDFTIEVWVYLKSNSVGVIYSNEVANSLFLYLNSGNLVVRNYGTTNLFDLAGPSLNTWTHIALSRSGTDLRLFFNGVQQGSTVTNSTNWTQNGTEIGAYNNGTQSLNGYMSNLRVVKGTALYTAAFTPPTKSLTAVTNTKLLTCQGNTITDASSSGHTLTTNGDAAANLGSPASAFEFDGSNDYVTTGDTLTDADELYADTGNAWSTSSWFNVDVISGADKAVTGRGGGVGQAAVYAVWVENANLRVRLRGGTITNISTSIAINTWYNVAVTWDGSTARGYLNGQFVTTLAVGTASNQTNTFTIGATNSGSLSEMNGKISQTLVYNKTLTASEIQQNYTALKGRHGY